MNFGRDMKVSYFIKILMPIIVMYAHMLMHVVDDVEHANFYDEA